MNPSFLQGENFEDVTKEQPLENNLLKKTRTLTPRTYLGVGYIHTFKNDTTQELVNVPCTQAEYESLAGVDGSSNNPALAGHTWVSSSGGTIKVDTADTLLGEDEYCIDGEDVIAVVSGVKDDSKYQRLTIADVDIADQLDESKIVT